MGKRKTGSKWRLHDCSIWYLSSQLTPRRPPPAVLPLALMVIVTALLLLTAVTTFAQVLGTDKVSYRPGEAVLVTGQGWQPGEAVSLLFGNRAGTRSVMEVKVAAGADGTFGNGTFRVLDYDGDDVLMVTARGASGGEALLAFRTGFAPGTLSCSSLSRFDGNHYGISRGETVTCTIEGAAGLSALQQEGQEPVQVTVGGNSPGGAATVLSVEGDTITFRFTAAANGCGSGFVSYGPVAMCDEKSGRCTALPAAGNSLAAGFTYADVADTSCNSRRLRVQSFPGNAVFTQGSQISYKVVVTNPEPAGGNWANNVRLTDKIPGNGGLAFENAVASQGSCVTPVADGTLDCSLGAIPPQGSATIVLSSGPSTPPTACQVQPENQAVATADGTVIGYGTGAVSCTPPPQLKVVASPDNLSFNKGARLNFNIVVSNPAQGSSIAKRVQVSSQLPGNGGLIWSMVMPGTCMVDDNNLSCSVGDIAPGGSTTISVYSVGTTPVSACQSQPATFRATAIGGVVAEDEASWICNPDVGLLALTVTPDNGFFLEEEPLTFTLTVSNPAASGVASNVRLTDQLPGAGGLSWSTVSPSQGACSVADNMLNCGLGTIPAGGSVQVKVSTPPVTPFAACRDQGNVTALATADEGLTARDNGLFRCPPSQLRLNVTPDNDFFYRGGAVKYTMVISNPAQPGSSPAKNVRLTDALPTNGGLTWNSVTTTQGVCSIVNNELNCSLGNIPAAASVTVEVSSPSSTPASACQPQDTVATATADGGLMAFNDGSQRCGSSANLNLVRTVSNASPGQPPTYTYTLTNLGTVTLYSIVVREDSGTPSDPYDDIMVGTVGSLLPGASATLTRTGTLPAGSSFSDNLITARLGTAGPKNFAMLDLGGDASQDDAGIYCALGTIEGNVGIVDNGYFHNAEHDGTPCLFNGDYHHGEAVNYIDLGGKITGQFITDAAFLDQAREDAFQAAKYFAGLPVTPTVQAQFPRDGQIKTDVIVTGTPGLNVVRLRQLVLAHGHLILTGPPGTQFVINIEGGLKLNVGQISEAGGVGPYDVIYNVTEPSASVGTGLPVDVIGILLAPYNEIHALYAHSWRGEIIGGYNRQPININYAAKIIGNPSPTVSTATAVVKGYQPD